MFRLFGGGRGPEGMPDHSTVGPEAERSNTPPQPPQDTPQTLDPSEPSITNQPETGENIFIAVPKELAQEVLPTIQYIYKNNIDKFILKRSHDPIATLLNPERIKSAGEERRIDQLAEEKITKGEAENLDEARQKLLYEHIYAPPMAQHLDQLRRGLGAEEKINLTFLTDNLQSRFDHEDGVAKGDLKHWSYEKHGGKGPSKETVKKSEKERDKMDRFLKELAKLIPPKS